MTMGSVRSVLLVVSGWFILSLWGCRGGQGLIEPGNVVYEPVYAEGFTIYELEGHPVIKVTNPWQGADGIEKLVCLSADGRTSPRGFKGMTVKFPLEKVVCLSSSYVAFIDALGRVDAVSGVSGLRYIWNRKVHENASAGMVSDIGYDFTINYELLSAMEPDVIFIYGLAGENDIITGKLDQLGLPYVYIGDYLENSPLGKSEWLVMFGEMFGMRERAVEIFNGISTKYTELRDRVGRNIDSLGVRRPEVLLNAPWKDSWFVPGDRSYMVRLIEDAGGNYVSRGVDNDISRPISLEQAFLYADTSEVWLNPGQVTTIREILDMNPKFSAIPPVVGGRVYNPIRRSTPEGGSDFWESGAVNPDVVLADLVNIFHPGLLDGNQLYYFQRLE